MTQTRNVEVVFIDAGTSGIGAYREVLKHTDSIVLIEGDQYGTTCARVGCIPSKLLIAPAEARHRAEKFDAFGLRGTLAEIDGKAVMQRVCDERDRFVVFIKESVEGFKLEHRIMAKATFVDDHTLALSNGEQIYAERIVIAVGSHPSYPVFLSGAGDSLNTIDHVFYLERSAFNSGGIWCGRDWFRVWSGATPPRGKSPLLWSRQQRQPLNRPRSH